MDPYSCALPASTAQSLEPPNPPALCAHAVLLVEGGSIACD